MTDTFFNLNQQTNNASVNTPQPAGNSFNTNLTSLINKDNIFQQSSDVLQKLFVPPNTEELKSKDLNSDSINVQATQNLNNFLNSLGFKINPATLESNNTPQKEQGPLELIARAKDSVYLVNEQDKGYLEDKSRIIYDNSTVAQFNSSGTLLAFASPNVLGVYVLAQKKALLFDLPNVIAMDFSPAQKYLITIDRRENKFFISIFEPDPLRKLYEFEAYRYKKETWPQVKFTQNDELAFWASRPTEIEVFNPRQNFRIINTIETRPFDFFNISGKLESLMLVCVGLEHSAGYDGHQGHIDIYRYHDLHHDKKPFVSKSIDKAHEVTLFFSPTGDNLLIWAQTFTDRTGQSYYGEHVLFYLDFNKKELKTVPTYKGPIHDVAWNPNGLEFIVISGFMPAGSVLFDSLCTPKFEFGRHHRNSIKWSPLSRFVCLGGFGNLPGDMDIWDVYSLKLVGTCKSQAAVSCKWAPDGRRLVTGVLNPRLRVSNNYKIFKYNGELLNHVDFSQSELYEVLWRPGGKFQDRPATPPKQPEKSENIEKADSTENNGTPVEGKKVFRPKGAGTFAAQLKAQKNARSGGRFLSPDERFEEVVVGEEQGEKKTEGEKEKKEEEQPKKPMSKILRRVDKKEGNGDNQNRENNLDGLDQKKETV